VTGSEGGHGGGAEHRLVPDGVPDQVVAAAKAALGRRGSPGELAVIISDFLDDNGGRGDSRSVWFKHDTGSMAVRITAYEERRTVQVRLDQPGSILVEYVDGATASPQEDTDGCWTFGAETGTLVRLWLRERPTGPPLHTEWLRL
jgi:hypothetical protein